MPGRFWFSFLFLHYPGVDALAPAILLLRLRDVRLLGSLLCDVLLRVRLLWRPLVLVPCLSVLYFMVFFATIRSRGVSVSSFLLMFTYNGRYALAVY